MAGGPSPNDRSRLAPVASCYVMRHHRRGRYGYDYWWSGAAGTSAFLSLETLPVLVCRPSLAQLVRLSPSGCSSDWTRLPGADGRAAATLGVVAAIAVAGFPLPSLIPLVLATLAKCGDAHVQSRRRCSGLTQLPGGQCSELTHSVQDRESAAEGPASGGGRSGVPYDSLRPVVGEAWPAGIPSCVLLRATRCAGSGRRRRGRSSMIPTSASSGGHQIKGKRRHQSRGVRGTDLGSSSSRGLSAFSPDSAVKVSWACSTPRRVL